MICGLTEGTLLLEALGTAGIFTLPGLFTRVGAHVLLEGLLCGKVDAADITLDGFDCCD